MMRMLLLSTMVWHLVSAKKTAGILYSLWHTKAATLMKQLKDMGEPLYTVEQVIRSDGKLILNDVYAPLGGGGDIYAATPAELGFYCMYRARPGEVGWVPDCTNITQTATRHAKMLTDAGFDYITVDVTNWGVADDHAMIDILRPIEVLAEEWLKLRQKGIRTPNITVWPRVDPNADGTHTESWQWLFDNLYNLPKYEGLIQKQEGKKLIFLPSKVTPAYGNASLVAEIESNGGRNDVIVRSMMAFLSPDAFEKGTWSFFPMCLTDKNISTVSMVGESSCNQRKTMVTNDTYEISASGSYMISQGSLPFGSPGHFRGLTVQRTFEKILNEQPPHIFMSSFNEWIGGRQASAYGANTAINIGLPNDPGKKIVWVETYAAEFSRDMEPSVEGGNRTWLVASSCVQLYKAGKNCRDAPSSLCCDRKPTEIFANAWALRKGNDSLVSTISAEVAELKEVFKYIEQCNPVIGPSVFCVNRSLKDAREGPFMLYSVQTRDTPTRALYRCYSSEYQRHSLSVEPCENENVTQVLLGYVAIHRGSEMLRGLNRCKDPLTGRIFHSLDLECDYPDSDKPLGFVR